MFVRPQCILPSSNDHCTGWGKKLTEEEESSTNQQPSSRCPNRLMVRLSVGHTSPADLGSLSRDSAKQTYCKRTSINASINDNVSINRSQPTNQQLQWQTILQNISKKFKQSSLSLWDPEIELHITCVVRQILTSTFSYHTEFLIYLSMCVGKMCITAGTDKNITFMTIRGNVTLINQLNLINLVSVI